MDQQTVAEKKISNNLRISDARVPIFKNEYSFTPQLMFLKRSLGNQATLRLFRSYFLQTKLTVSHPDEMSELEADRIADQVMRIPEAQVQRQAPKEEKEKPLQAKGGGEESPEVDAVTESRIDALQGKGAPLSDSVRSFMEPRFGVNFSHVRVHTDGDASETARALNSQAFTVGRDIVFRAGHYAPESESGKQLLAHELCHVVQQSNYMTKSLAQAKAEPSSQSSPETKQQEPPEPEITQTGGIIYFRKDEVDPRPNQESALRIIGETLQTNPILKASLTGHTSWEGTEKVNTDISIKRAENIRTIFKVTYKINEDRLGTDNKLAKVQEKTKEERERNRRVDIVFDQQGAPSQDKSPKKLKLSLDIVPVLEPLILQIPPGGLNLHLSDLTSLPIEDKDKQKAVGDYFGKFQKAVDELFTLKLGPDISVKLGISPPKKKLEVILILPHDIQLKLSAESSGQNVIFMGQFGIINW